MGENGDSNRGLGILNGILARSVPVSFVQKTLVNFYHHRTCILGLKSSVVGILVDGNLLSPEVKDLTSQECNRVRILTGKLSVSYSMSSTPFTGGQTTIDISSAEIGSLTPTHVALNSSGFMRQIPHFP